MHLNIQYNSSFWASTKDNILLHQVFTVEGDDRPQVEDILIVFTDGWTRDQTVAVKYAEKMKARNVHIIAIAAGPSRRDFKGQLEEIASTPSDVLMVEFDELQNLISKLVNKVCKAPPSKFLKL